MYVSCIKPFGANRSANNNIAPIVISLMCAADLSKCSFDGMSSGNPLVRTDKTNVPLAQLQSRKTSCLHS